MSTENNSEKKDFCCYTCNKVYTNQSGLWKHNQNHHLKENQNKEKKNTFACKKCKTEFNSQPTRWRHEKKCQFMDTATTMSTIKNQVVEINKIKNELEAIKSKLNEETSKTKETNQTGLIINDTLNEETSKTKENNTTCLNYYIINNNKIDYRQEDNLIDITEILNIENKQFNLWLKNQSTISFINNLSTKLNTLHDELIKKENSTNVYVHENIACEFVSWISPTHGINFKKWLDEYKTKKQNKTKSSESYPDNVVYIVTNKFNKENNIYVIGKAQNLKNRLATYNKSNEHEVIYYKQCDSQKMTHVVESMVLLTLHKYREYLNRDRFVLPKDKSISFFTDVIDKAVNFFSLENSN